MQNKNAPLLNTTLRWFLLAMILANIAGQMVYTLLAVYLAELEANAAQIGLVFSLASIVPMVLQIFGGWLSDTIGRLRMIAIGSTCATLGYLGFILAPSWEWMTVALALEYVAGAAVGPSFSAFIAEQTSEENLGRVFGISKGIFMTVGVIGPPLAGFLAYRFGFRAMFVAAFALYASASALRVWMARSARFSEKAAEGELTLRAFGHKLGLLFGALVAGGLLTWILITDGVQDISFRLSWELEPVYLSKVGGMSVEQIGWLHSVRATAILLAMFPAGWLSDRRGERIAILSGFLLEAVGLWIFLVAKGFLGFALSGLVFGIGIGVMHPAYDALIAKVVPERMRGLVFGLFATSLGLLSLPAPWLGGLLWERFSPRLPFAITVVAVLLSIIPVWFKFKLPEKDQDMDSGEPQVDVTPAS